jgi:hypothetical protein
MKTRVAVAIAFVLWATANAGAKRRARFVPARLAASPVQAKGAQPATGPSVQFVTEKRAYLNRGARDGLAPKQPVQLVRGGRALGTCTIETVGDHQATCVGARARVGDSFRLPARASTRKPPTPPELPPLVEEATLRERAAVVAEASYDKVDFNGAHALAAHAHASLSPGFTIWRTEPDPRGDYALEELDATVQVYDVGGSGLDFAAAFTAMHWGARASIGRFQPASPNQFYLWEAEVTRRRAEAGTVAAVGRIWPWHTPGLVMLDGFQVGRRNEAETAEGGVYAGFLPNPITTAPSTESWVAGAYGTLAQTGTQKGTFRLAREEARLGVWSGPGTGLVTDADLLAQTWLGVWNVAVGGRALLAPSVTPGPVIDRATFDLGARPTARLGAGAHLRYFGTPLPAVAALSAVIPTARGLLSALADVHWNVSARLGVAGFASFNQERDSGRALGTAGAELRLAGLGDGLSLGGELETGWLRGAFAYAQLAARASERLRLLARMSVSATEFEVPAPAPNVDEVGGYLHVEGALAAWLRLRAWSMLRVPVLIQGALPTQTTYGVVLGGSLTGAY